jgi:hypothetical protein
MVQGLASERSYTLQTLPRGIIRGLADTLLHFDPAGLARSAAIAAGLVLTTAGYIVGSISLCFTRQEKILVTKSLLP